MGLQCYLPPGSGDFPAFTPAEEGTRFSDPGGMQGWVDLLSPCYHDRERFLSNLIDKVLTQFKPKFYSSGCEHFQNCVLGSVRMKSGRCRPFSHAEVFYIVQTDSDRPDRVRISTRSDPNQLKCLENLPIVDDWQRTPNWLSGASDRVESGRQATMWNGRRGAYEQIYILLLLDVCGW